MKQKARLVEVGMNEADAFEALLDSDRWIPGRSEDGWYRMIHKTKPYSMVIEYDGNGIVTKIHIA